MWVIKLIAPKKEKPRLAWIGADPSYTWGLSIVTRELLKRMPDFENFILTHNAAPSESMSTQSYSVYSAWNTDGLIYWLRQVKPDIIVIYNPIQWLNKYVDSAAKMNYMPDCPIILYVTAEAEPLLPFFADKIVEMQPEIVLSPSKWTSDIFGREGFETGHLYHGVEPRIYRPMPHLRENREDFIYGCVARNDRRKGIERLIKAVSLIQEENVKLHLMTSPKEMNLGEDLRVVGDLYGAMPKIDFYELMVLGVPLDSIYMGGVFNNFNVNILPTSGEAFGLPVLEAMACGIPNIVTDIPVMREIYGDNVEYVPTDGYTITSRGEFPLIDVESLAAHMIILREDKDRYDELAKKGIEHAKRFTWEGASKKLTEILHKYL